MRTEILKTLWRSRTPGLLGRKYACAVLCPFVEKEDGLHLLFEVRATSLRRQGGEVCFPGGRMEPGETAEICALRETEEELRISPVHVQLLGRPDYLSQAGKFSLEPVVGLVEAAGLAAMRPSAAEVESVFTVPLEFFRTQPPKIYTCTLEPNVPADFPYDEVGVSPAYRWDTGEAEIPIWHWEGHTIWGLTGRIVKNLIETMG